jgi:hypothetical protein
MWIGFAVWTALCGAGCQETSSHGTSDLGTSTDLATTRADLYQPPDLSHPPAVSMTIRDINDGKVSAGTWVVVEGVVTAPSVLGSAIMLNQQCLYELVIGQPAAAPTLHDGIALRLSEVVATGDMMVTPADCQSRAAGSILGKVSRGDAVTVTAQFVVFGSLRYLNLAGGQLTSQGPAATKPQPVLVTTSQLVSATLGGVTPAAFFDANGALVRFASVTTTQRNNLNQSWKIAASGSETRLGPAYLRVANAAFAPPADGTVYSSVTGIVAIDLAGTVTPRDASDLVP